jgi:protein PhnA
MKISNTLLNRCHSACELCESPSEQLHAYIVPARTEEADENAVALCDTCMQSISDQDYSNANYFMFLTGSIWSEVPPVKVLSYKILSRLSDQEWAQGALDSAALTEEELSWANSEQEALAGAVVHKDAYGMVLQHGDTVFLTENLNVKGANFMAAKGTKVPKIRLVPDNPEQIEGKIEGSTIVILTKFVRKGN